MSMLAAITDHYHFAITMFLLVTGLYIVVARGNMVKKLVGLSIFQTSVYLLYVEPAKIIGGTATIIDPAFTVYSNPLPHVLMLTAIVVGVATLALGLALVCASTRPTAPSRKTRFWKWTARHERGLAASPRVAGRSFPCWARCLSDSCAGPGRPS